MSGAHDGAMPLEFAALVSDATNTAAVVRRVVVRLMRASYVPGVREPCPLLAARRAQQRSLAGRPATPEAERQIHEVRDQHHQGTASQTQVCRWFGFVLRFPHPDWVPMQTRPAGLE